MYSDTFFILFILSTFFLAASVLIASFIKQLWTVLQPLPGDPSRLGVLGLCCYSGQSPHLTSNVPRQQHASLCHVFMKAALICVIYKSQYLMYSTLLCVFAFDTLVNESFVIVELLHSACLYP